MRRNIIKAICLSALFGLLFTLGYNSYVKEVTFPEIVVHFAFGYNRFSYNDIINMCTLTVPYFTFMFIFGMSIYEHYIVSSVYYFSRCNNRVKWFVKEMLKLLLYTFIFVATMPIFGIVGASVSNDIIHLENGYMLYLCYVVIYTSWLYALTLITNVVAIRYNGYIGLIVSAGITFLFASLLCLWDEKAIFSMEFTDNPYLDRNGIILMFNLFSHLVLSWHTTSVEELELYIGRLGVKYDVSISICLFIIIAIVISQISVHIVKKQEVFSVSEKGI